jgi:catechol 2,3-dioxygenase-like lactoylglutathione lyase family enzyme
MAILGVQSLVYGVDDMELCRRFWQDFGLTETTSESDHCVFETMEGSTVELRPIDSAVLPPAPEPGNTVRQTVWGVESPSDLDVVAAALVDQPGYSRDENEVRALDPDGYALAFRSGFRRPLNYIDETYNTARRPRRPGRRGEIHQRAFPQLMSHVVYYTRHFDASVAFYEKLNFTATDSYPGRSIFLRAEGSVEHHNLFLLNITGKSGFHHVAFECRSIHEVLGGGLYLGDRGWKTLYGPGRHPVSSAYFWYFVNPCGGAAEYDWDSDVISDAWEPREWPLVNSTFAEWLVPDGVKRFQGFAAQNRMRELTKEEIEALAKIDKDAADKLAAALG